MSKETVQSHNPVEKQIRIDIGTKNELRKQFEKDLRLIKKYNDLLKKVPKDRKTKKYTLGKQRVIENSVLKKQSLSKIIPELEKRVAGEMKFSESEITELEKLYKKEYDEMLEARNLLAKVQNEKLSQQEILELTGKSVEELQAEFPALNKKSPDKLKLAVPREYLLSKASKKLKLESTDVKEVTKEQSSEARDKILFEGELKRMIFERTILNS